MYRENELVMYGTIGVCRIFKIGIPDFRAEQAQDTPLYYFLEPLYQSGTIYAPVDSESIFIRPVISAEEAHAILGSIDEIEPDNYHSRSVQQMSQHYQRIIDTHSCKALLSLAKSIYRKGQEALQNNKHLGQIDKRFKKRAEDLLFGEFAVALDTDRERIEDFVYDQFDREFRGDFS